MGVEEGFQSNAYMGDGGGGGHDRCVCTQNARGNSSEKSPTIHRNKTVLKCIKCMFVYSLSLECNVFRTCCGICKGRVRHLIVKRVKYEYVHNFIAGCVCVQGRGRG